MAICNQPTVSVKLLRQQAFLTSVMESPMVGTFIVFFSSTGSVAEAMPLALMLRPRRIATCATRKVESAIFDAIEAEQSLSIRRQTKSVLTDELSRSQCATKDCLLLAFCHQLESEKLPAAEDRKVYLLLLRRNLFGRERAKKSAARD